MLVSRCINSLFCEYLDCFQNEIHFDSLRCTFGGFGNYFIEFFFSSILFLFVKISIYLLWTFSLPMHYRLKKKTKIWIFTLIWSINNWWMYWSMINKSIVLLYVLILFEFLMPKLRPKTSNKWIFFLITHFCPLTYLIDGLFKRLEF